MNDILIFFLNKQKKKINKILYSFEEFYKY